jgi:hypothetical protein
MLSDQKDEIAALHACLGRLENGESTEIIISDLPIAQSRLRVGFSAKPEATGITVSKDGKNLFVALTTNDWLSMCGKLEPFLAQQSGFVWLYESKFYSLLFTTDGYW